MARRIIASIVAALLVTTSSGNASASGFGGAWQTAIVPFTVELIDATTNGMSPYIQQAAAEWSASGIIILAYHTGSCGKKKGAITVCNVAGGLWQGAAWASSVYTRGYPYLKQITVTFNDYYDADWGVWGPSAYQRLWSACHELGIATGDQFPGNPEDKNTDPTSCYSGNQAATAPARSDFDQLALIYPNP